MYCKGLIHYLFINLKDDNCNLNSDAKQQFNVLSLFSKYQSDDYYFINHFDDIYNEIKSKIEQEMIELKQHKKKYIKKQMEKIALSVEEKLNRKWVIFLFMIYIIILSLKTMVYFMKLSQNKSRTIFVYVYMSSQLISKSL